MKNKTLNGRGHRLSRCSALLDHTDWSQFLTLYGGEKNRERLLPIQAADSLKKIREWFKSRFSRRRKSDVHHPIRESFSLDHIGPLNPSNLLQLLKEVADAIPRVGRIRIIDGCVTHTIMVLVWSNESSSATGGAETTERK